MIALAEECWLYAQECRREAKLATATTDKASWLHLAEEWMTLARDVEEESEAAEFDDPEIGTERKSN